MRLAGYYRRFIERFSKIAHLINYLQKKGIKIGWTFKCETCFQKLKEMLISASVLKIVNPDENFVVCIDGCQQCIGGVLTQNGHVIFYESRKLKEHKQNYATHGFELATTIYALKIWRHYLMGKKIELRIDRH